MVQPSFTPELIDELNRRFDRSQPQALLEWAVDRFGKEVALCTALGPEAMVLLHCASKLRTPLRVFTLDTGRLPRETHELMQRCEELYGMRFELYTPDPSALQEMVREHGINAFYRSVQLRELCCEVRKVRPLLRALEGLSAWVTGLSRAQAATRRDVRLIEIDTGHNDIVKINPLANWSEQSVWDYITDHGLPYNALHNRGYRSIGCAPCTRATNPGEDIRAGRWWWEESAKKECGLHTTIVNGTQIVSVADGSAPEMVSKNSAG